VHAAAFGRADDSGRPVTAQTPVLLASTSKTLTAIAVMQQVEAGRLRLDEPVQAYLPWFTLDDPRSSAITVRHLLHQAGGMATKDTAFEASDAQGPEALEVGVRAIDSNILRILHAQAPVPAVVQEDWLQRYSWAVALGLLLAELLSLRLSLRFLLARRHAPAGTR
jgi:CubicO group peptidase (beta-lactamase class C family)